MQLSFDIFSISLNLPYIKNELNETLDYWFRDMLNFNFSEKSLELVSPPTFAYDFEEKCVSWYILLTGQI